MLRALYSSASGMQSQQMNLDVIANNLANVNTTGFKRSKIEFQDLLYQTNKQPGADAGSGNQIPTGIQIGHGSRPVSTSRVFTMGELSQTGEKLDIAIAGDGFFEVQMPDGTRAFTRDGSLKADSNGRVVTSDGLPILGFPAIQPGTTAITISPSGTVSIKVGDQAPQNSQLSLVRFANAGGLQTIGRNLFRESPSSGTAETGQPGQNGFGELTQGFLELSNVKVVEEMVNLIMAQRAYEINSKAIQAADEMMQQSNNLRR
jgi:flagellar basal-body rod protein FlgG